MKKELEQLLIYLIPSIIISKFVYSSKTYFFGELFSDDHQVMLSAMSKFPEYSPGQLITFVNLSTTLIALIPALTVSVWIYKLEKKSGRPFLWAIGAFLLKYWILVLYLGQRLITNEKQTTQERF